MRNARLLLGALLFTTLVPCGASGQRVRDFEDSWFWGVKGGVTTFAPTFGDVKASGSYGVEWLITRRHGALNISIDESRLTATSAVFDPSFEGTFRPVRAENLRRVSAAALVFPRAFGKFRPYAGLGLAVSVLGDAYPLVAEDETEVDDLVWERVDERSSQAGLLVMGGGQFHLGRVAVFGQASMVPSNNRFLLNDSALGFFEVGLRYNFLGAREGIR